MLWRPEPGEVGSEDLHAGAGRAQADLSLAELRERIWADKGISMIWASCVCGQLGWGSVQTKSLHAVQRDTEGSRPRGAEFHGRTLAIDPNVSSSLTKAAFRPR